MAKTDLVDVVAMEIEKAAALEVLKVVAPAQPLRTSKQGVESDWWKMLASSSSR
ncbi:MAG: hypothetical protein U1G07_15105 [Verrucomicrobiota bacterium]